MLEEMKQERQELIQQKMTELTQIKEEKRSLLATSTDYRKPLQEKKEKVATLLSELEEEKEKVRHSDKVLAHVVLMLKRIVPILIPEKKDKNVTMENAERYLTLCGLSLEQKATILSFRNRSIPIESVSEDPATAGRQDTAKDKPEEKQEVEPNAFMGEEELFHQRARDKLKDKKIEDKLTALQKIEEEEKKEQEMKEQEQGIFLEQESHKMARKNVTGQSKRDEIEFNKKDRTKRFLRMQNKYAGSKLFDTDYGGNANKKPWTAVQSPRADMFPSVPQATAAPVVGTFGAK